MLIEEVFFSLYDRNQNYSKKRFWILEKKSKPFFQHCSWKNTSATSSISLPRGFKETNSFSYGTNEMFLPITRDEISKWGQILFLWLWFNSLEDQIGQHICHFSTRFLHYRNRAFAITSCFKILTTRAKHQNKIAKKSN